MAGWTCGCTRLASQDDRRCVEFWRAMASGDAAFSRGEMIYQSRDRRGAGQFRARLRIRGRCVCARRAHPRSRRIRRSADAPRARVRVAVRGRALSGSRRGGARRRSAFQSVGPRVRPRSRALLLGVGDDPAWPCTRPTSPKRSGSSRRRGTLSSRSPPIICAAASATSMRSRSCAAAYVGGNVDRYAEAISDWQRALEAFDGQYEPERMVKIRQNLAYFEFQLGRYQEALKLHYEILAEGDNIKEPGAYFTSLTNTAFVELKLGKYDAALRHYSDAYARSLRTNTALVAGHGAPRSRQYLPCDRQLRRSARLSRARARVASRGTESSRARLPRCASSPTCSRIRAAGARRSRVAKRR